MASNDGSENSPRGLLGRNRGRLPSLRAPRDLTLGGSSKKTFVPNIPSRPRDKARDSQPSTSSNNEGSGHRSNRGKNNSARGGKGGRGRGRGRDQELIQTQSIFEQGAADRIKPRSTFSPVERSSSNSAARPTSTTLKKEKRDDADTKRIIENLLRDDFVEGAGLQGSDPSMNPIQLPLFQVKSEVKQEVKVKEEDGDEDVKDDSETKPVSTNAIRTDDYYPIDPAEMFQKAVKSESGDMMIFHLPDTLPGEPPDLSDDRHKKDKKPAETLEERLGLCSLRDFSEGIIGKLQIHKSGRTRLLLGNVSLDVTMGTPTGFLQEVVSARIDGQSGDMSVLGHVQHKMVCSPDFEAMLDNS